MKQFIKNIWNAQRNARRVEELEIQIELMAYPHNPSDDAICCTESRIGSQFCAVISKLLYQTR